MQLGKVSAFLYLALSLILVPMLLMASAVGSTGTGMPAALIMALPIIYVALGFLCGVCGAWLYNLAVKFTGGIAIELE